MPAGILLCPNVSLVSAKLRGGAPPQPGHWLPSHLCILCPLWWGVMLCSDEGAENALSQNSTNRNISKKSLEMWPQGSFGRFFWRDILCIQRQEYNLNDLRPRNGAVIRQVFYFIEANFFFTNFHFPTGRSLNDNPRIYPGSVTHLSCHSFTYLFSLSTKCKSMWLRSFILWRAMFMSSFIKSSMFVFFSLVG